MTNLAQYRAVAEAATPGPWQAYGEPEVGLPPSLFSGNPMQSGFGPIEPLTGADLHYCATFDPPTVLALIAELEAARVRVERLEQDALASRPPAGDGVERGTAGEAQTILNIVRKALYQKLPNDIHADVCRSVAYQIFVALASPQQEDGVSASVYESAVKGRQDFRNAYRELLPVLRAAEALSRLWRTNGQRVDVTEFWDAINAVDVAVSGGSAKPEYISARHTAQADGEGVGSD